MKKPFNISTPDSKITEILHKNFPHLLLNMKKILIFTSFLAVLTLITPTACYYDNEVEQYGTTVCDTVALSYSIHIHPIIKANCVSCHTPGGQQSSSPMNTFEQVKPYATSREIVQRIRGDGQPLMPPAGAMSSCDQEKIAAWVNAGSPNN